MANLRKVTHVLFDMDGLLLDTEKVYGKVFEDIVAKFNKTLPTDIRIKFLGSTERRSCEICVTDLGLPITVDEFQKEFRSLSLERLGDVDLMPGAEKLIRHLSKNNVPICIATSSGAESVAVKTKRNQELFKLFHHIVMGSSDPEVKQGKPAPDIFLIAASRFPDKPDPKNCLVIEDAPNGVQGATDAGMQSVMVPANYVPDELKKDATVVLKSLNEINLEMFGLPPFE